MTPDKSTEACQRVALEAIKHICQPGQMLGISDAIDLICDVYNMASAALAMPRETAVHAHLNGDAPP